MNRSSTSMTHDRSSLQSHHVWALATWFAVAIMYVTTLPQIHLRDDEELSYRFTQPGLIETFEYVTYQDIHPPAWHILFWSWRRIVGDSEFAGRLQSALFSLIAVAFAYRCGREWFGGVRYGAIAMLVCGISAYHVYYALEIRPYGLAMLVAALAMWLFGRWMQTGRRRWAVGWGAAVGVMGYVHYILAFLPLVQVIYFMTAARPSPRYLAGLLWAAAVGALVFAPWLPQFIYQVSLLRQVTQAQQIYGSGIGTFSTAVRTTPESIGQLINLMTNGHPAIYAVVIGAGIVWELRRRARQRLYFLTLMWGIGVPALVLTANLWFGVYSPRYIAHVTLGVALTIAVGLTAFSNLRPLRQRTPASKAFARVGWFFLVIFFGLNALSFSRYLPMRVPHRDIFRAMVAHVHPDDRVYFLGTSVDDPVARWQMRQYLPLAIYDQPLTRLNEPLPRRVWFITDEWLRDDVQSAFRALEMTHPLQFVAGDCVRTWCYLAQLMEAPPSSEPRRFGQHMAFYGVDIDRQDRAAIEARLWWKVDARISLDYSIGLHLLNEAGDLVAQKDGPIDHYAAETVPTSHMEPGRIYIDHRTMMLPLDLPSGTYRLSLVVYQPWDGQRLQTDDGSDRVIAAEIVLD